LTSVQKYFNPLIFESKILFKIQKKKEFMLQPPWLSAYFRLSIGSHLQLPSAPLRFALPTVALLHA
jgi:hypothetical protein